MVVIMQLYPTKNYATKKRQDKYPTLYNFDANGIVKASLRQTESQTETDEIEAILNAAKKILSIREEIQKLNEESKEIVEGLKTLVDNNKQELENRGIIKYRGRDKFLKLPGGVSISIWENFYIPDDKLNEVADMLEKNGLGVLIDRTINKTSIEWEFKKHYSDSNSDDRLRKIVEDAKKIGALEIKKVVVVKKKEEEE